MLDYKLIEAYAVVLQEGGFDKGARRLCITQSAVSQRIKQLEEQFGQVVLLRTTPPQPTDFGKKILRLYNQVHQLENELRRSQDDSPMESFTSLPLGLNADSLATWFFEAVRPFLQSNMVVFDLMVDDQEETHRFLREGKVLGCVSTRSVAMQGCNVHYLGDVGYGIFCSPAFYQKWFTDGFTIEAAVRAPMITFNRKDHLNQKILARVLGKALQGFSSFYVPSSELFLDFIKNGMAYGSVPDQQSSEPLERDEIIELAPEHREWVSLYWHCWNLESDLLRGLTRQLIRGFARIHKK
jgi:LysR family transcriptional regulator (chromosome initiation inhibitor)